MDVYCILILLLISILACKYIFKKDIVEGFNEGEDEDEGEDEGEDEDEDEDEDEGEDEDEDEDEQYYYELEQENYLDEAGFDAMIRKGLCTDEPDSPLNHSCKIDDALEDRPQIDMRYVNLPPSELNPSLSHTYVNLCPQTYQTNMNILDSKVSMGQYSGYSDNAYLDRIRYDKSDDPLPVNPDFFMNGGGTFA